jgi:hypothetical protein
MPIPHLNGVEVHRAGTSLVRIEGSSATPEMWGGQAPAISAKYQA